VGRWRRSSVRLTASRHSAHPRAQAADTGGTNVAPVALQDKYLSRRVRECATEKRRGPRPIDRCASLERLSKLEGWMTAKLPSSRPHGKVVPTIGGGHEPVRQPPDTPVDAPKAQSGGCGGNRASGRALSEMLLGLSG